MADHPSTEIIRTMQDSIDRVLRPLLPQGTFSLLGFPHFGVGDCASWLGMMTYLRDVARHPPSYLDDIDDYLWGKTAEDMPEGDVLLHGGNGFGDVWPEQLYFKGKVIAENRGRKILILPQTVHFKDHAALANTAENINAHGGVTMLVRDEESLAYVQKNFSCAVHLCPDPAWYLGVMERRVTPILTLLFEGWRPEDSGREVSVFLKDRKGGVKEVRLSGGGIHAYACLRGAAYRGLLAENPLRIFSAMRRREALFDCLALNILENGLKQLGEAEQVVTKDHEVRVLCTLMGINCSME